MSRWRFTASQAVYAFVAVVIGWSFGSVSAADSVRPLIENDSASDTFGLSANSTFTTDYIFRGISQTDERPAVQGGVEATYGVLYLGIWGSNVDFGLGLNEVGDLEKVADLEIDWYAGARTSWLGISFDLGLFYYSYPGSLGAAELDYVEIGTAASYTLFDQLTLEVTNWWSPENAGQTGMLDVLELGGSYTFNKIWILSPKVSALVGRQWGQKSKGGFDYTYWNAGLTVDFYEAPALNFDVRYWDTNLAGCSFATLFQCDSRIVGSLNAAF